MLLWLYTHFPDSSLLNVLRYPSFRIVMSTLTALVVCLLFYPALIRRLQIFKFGQEVRKEGPESHYKKKGTPTMGGTLILLAVFVSTVLWTDVTHKGVWLVLLVTMGYGAIGFYDDYLKVTRQTHAGFSGRTRILAEALIAAGACYAFSQLGRMPFRLVDGDAVIGRLPAVALRRCRVAIEEVLIRKRLRVVALPVHASPLLGIIVTG